MHLEVEAPRAGPMPRLTADPTRQATREILDQQGHRIEKVEHREFDR